ncbi:MAG TPA: DUF4105 domain-containing protein [Candidatus Binatia bacterium]|nr:DUF4105 domain-containing protein [Candidatus Binatia bacterium]
MSSALQTRRHRSWARPALILLASLAALVVAGFTGWGSLAIFYRAPLAGTMREALAMVMAVLGFAAIVGLYARRVRRATIAFVAVTALLLLWWSTIKARNDRDWQPEVARLAYADINGDQITIHNIRNFDYRTETDFTPRYYDKTFDLKTLDTADLIASYWMGDAIAHMMVSFGFGGKDYLTVSIETRKERSESYSTLAGFFREYELYYVVADERDLIRVRTNYRKDPPEDVYLYRTNAPPENVRRLFLSYIEKINSLKDHPEFYNTLTTNCTTNIWMHTKVNQQSVPLNWKILASGYVPLLAYEYGRLDTRLPFEELRRRSHINQAAQAADSAEDFSQRIRASVPAPLRPGGTEH